MNDKVVDTHNLLQHLPKHQKKFIIKHHPDYLKKLTNEYEAKIERAMNIPPGVYEKFNRLEAQKEYQMKLQKLAEEKVKKDD